MQNQKFLIAAIIGAFTINPTKTMATLFTVQINSGIRTFSIGNDTYDSFYNKPSIKTGDVLKIEDTVENKVASITLLVTDKSGYLTTSRSLTLDQISLGFDQKSYNSKEDYNSRFLNLGRKIATVIIYYCRNKLDIESNFRRLIERMNIELRNYPLEVHFNIYQGMIKHIKDHNKEENARAGFGQLFSNGKVEVDLKEIGKTMAEYKPNGFVWDESKLELSWSDMSDIKSI